MTFGKLANFILEAADYIPEDAEVTMEIDCCDDLGIIYWDIKKVRFENGKVILY